MVSDEALKKLQEQIAAWPQSKRWNVCGMSCASRT